MKVILSRKGMDSRAGGIPSPILPDGTLLSLPIPEHSGGVPYEKLSFHGQPYREIICHLQPNFDFDKNPACHLDPDIYNEIEGRPAEWKPAFGQCDASARHLDKLDVGVGDVFLFYGMFRQTEYDSQGLLHYVRSAPILHIIYGYLVVGEVLRETADIKSRYGWHPHALDAERAYNRLYIPSAYGTLPYDKRLILTKPGQQKRRVWELPGFFAEDGISISWQGQNRPVLCGNHAELESACRGQEFVITTPTPELEQKLERWVEDLIHPTPAKKEMVNHILYPDNKGQIYCRKENDIVSLDFSQCNHCPLLGGGAQGNGVECYYEDMVSESYYNGVPNHHEEKKRISALIEKGVVDAMAVRR